MTTALSIFFALIGLQANTEQGQGLVDDVLTVTSEIRGLKVLRPVKAVSHSKKQILAYVKQRIAEEYPGDSLEEEGRLLKHLGWLPSEMDYRATLEEFVTAQVAGYFDPFKERFVLATWLPGLIQKPIIAHELVHALQDQHFGLKKALKRIPGNDDATIARSAVIEGDATIAMLAYSMGGTDMEALVPAAASVAEQTRNAPTLTTRHIPYYMRMSLIFPYTGAIDLLLKKMEKQKWAGVDALHKNYPQSTEQLLHPERYPYDKPLPVHLTIDSALGPWQESLRNRFGELGFRFLGSPTGKQDDLAAQLSEGWGGDQYVFLKKGAERGVVACVLTDEPAKRSKYRTLVELSLSARYNQPPAMSKAKRGQSMSDGFQIAWREVDQGLAWVELPDTAARAKELLEAAAQSCRAQKRP
ncbi:MAG: hypothetical protein CMH55_10305 [Myxococcales bacterium]|nr:hypothetical protein [Myxococcales bacterium]